MICISVVEEVEEEAERWKEGMAGNWFLVQPLGLLGDPDTKAKEPVFTRNFYELQRMSDTASESRQQGASQ